MTWRLRVGLALLVLWMPITSSAACTSEGYTIIYVNGILTSEEAARADVTTLMKDFGSSFNSQRLAVRSGYNPSHFGGGGDLLQSIAQAFSSSLSDYDLHTILMQIHPEVTTRKILLLGHSQGSFYTNEMYQYLTTHGVPRESIAVYNVATPASYVGGGGGYLTSSNDKVINRIRDTEINGNVQIHLNSYYALPSDTVRTALRANTTIPKENGWEADTHGGHHFGSVYLAGAGERIIADAQYELANLKAGAGDTQEGCFEPPAATLGYRAESALFALGDTAASGAMTVGKPVLNGGLALVNGISGAVGALASALWNVFQISSGGQAAAATLSVGTPVQPDVAPPTPAAPPTAPVSAAQPPQSAARAAGTPVAAAADAVRAEELPVVPLPPPLTQPFVPLGTPDMFAIQPGFGGGGGAPPQTDVEAQSGQPIAASQPADNTPPAVQEQAPLDTTPPETPVIAIQACSASLVASGCVLATTTTTVSWGSAAHAAWYAILQNGVIGATTTATSALATLSHDASTTLAVVAYNAVGDAATSTTIEVAALTRPLIISEVAWAGTGDSQLGIHNDRQWIELSNTSQYALDLSHVSITRSGGAPIQLSGAISPASSAHYLVVEPVAWPLGINPAATLVVPFSPLATTSAEQLSLVWNDGSTSTTLDATPSPGTCDGWCAGAYNKPVGSNSRNLPNYVLPLSMERRPHTPDGTLASSWQSTDTYGMRSYGTPAGDNSAGLPDAAVFCGSSDHALISTTDAPAFNLANGYCAYLSSFVTPSAQRAGGFFEGDIGSSTVLVSHWLGTSPQNSSWLDYIPSGTLADTHFFFAMWEVRPWPSQDNWDFTTYLTIGASTTAPLLPPHGNYVVLPFVYRP